MKMNQEVVLQKGEMTLNGGDKCEVVNKFCYLGDMFSVGGGANAAVVTRISSGWGAK